ncbi:MAG TPA: WbqC family protein [Azonexus sp.]|nr:WbqC family protein [Azonexus sp.]
MIVATHQPHYLPWLGYLDRMQKADLFVVLDHVQFERRNYQNRTRILLDGVPRWLTVPVVQASQLERVIDKQIDNSSGDKKSWGLKHYQTLRHAYRDAPFFDLYGPKLFKILSTCPERLVDMDQMTLDFLREALDIRTPLVNSSELNLSGARSELILNLCLAVGADTYLAGMGGSRTYLDRAMFAKAGVNIIWQEFQHPIYFQCGGGPFMPGLSAIDLLFNHGPQSTEILHRQPRPQRVAEVA